MFSTAEFSSITKRHRVYCAQVRLAMFFLTACPTCPCHAMPSWSCFSLLRPGGHVFSPAPIHFGACLRSPFPISSRPCHVLLYSKVPRRVWIILPPARLSVCTPSPYRSMFFRPLPGSTWSATHSSLPANSPSPFLMTLSSLYLQDRFTARIATER